MLLELPITLLENIYSTGVTHDNHHLQLQYVNSTYQKNLQCKSILRNVYNPKTAYNIYWIRAITYYTLVVKSKNK
jgi:hypothetical protein